MRPTNNHLATCCAFLAVGLVGCSLITDPSGLVGAPPPDAGARDGGGLDASLPQDAQVPDACVVTDEVCNGFDDDCDGTVDEEPTECSFENGITGCVSGTCELVGCVDDYGDCEDDVDGCESLLSDDRSHCGACDVECTLEERCVAASCDAADVAWTTFVTGVGSGYFMNVQLDGSGNPYVRGRSDGEGTFGGAEVVDGLWFIARLDPNDGTVAWTQTLAPDPSGMALLYDIHTTELGIVHVVGDFGGRVVTRDGLPLLDGGSLLWSIRPDGTTRDIRRVAIPTTGVAGIRAVDEVSGSSFAIAGFLEGELGGQVSVGRDLLVLSGPADSLTPFVSGGSGYQEAFDVVATPGGVCAAGAYNDTTDFGGGELPSRTSGLDAFVACFSLGGVHRWSRGYSSSTQDIGRSLIADAAGNIYLLLTTGGPLNVEGHDVDDTVPERVVVISYGPDGTVRWVIPTALTGTESALSIGTDGAVLVAGGGESNIGVGTSTVSNRGLADAVVLALDPGDGSLLWARAYGGSDRDWATQVSGEAGALFLAGTFRDVVMFDDVVTADANDGFVLRTE